MKEEQYCPKEIILQARESVRKNIKFLKNLDKDLLSNDKDKVTPALWGAWAIHTYMQNHFIQDLHKELDKVKKNKRG